MSALLSLRDLVGWQKISACVTAMAHVTEQQRDRSYSLVLQGFEALLLFQRYICNSRACLATLVCSSMLPLQPMQGVTLRPMQGVKDLQTSNFYGI